MNAHSMLPLLVLFALALAPAASAADAAPRYTPGAPVCDSVAYSGVQHCTDDDGQTYILIVFLRDSSVQVLSALSAYRGVECNSVNHSGPNKDPDSNCPGPPYPFERIPAMLDRYAGEGAVAVINTDYFGSSDGDHGAEGLAVRNGQRLDGPNGNDTIDGNATKRSSLAFSRSKEAQIGKPASERAIDTSGAYYNVGGGGPQIVRDGIPIADDFKACNAEQIPFDRCTRIAQSAAGLTRDGRLILITSKKTATQIATYLVDTFGVVSALKFDGGGSARMAWLDADQIPQTYGATDNTDKPENRAVAEGLVIFSKAVDLSAPGADGVKVADVPEEMTLEANEKRDFTIVVQNTMLLDWPEGSVILKHTSGELLEMPAEMLLRQPVPFGGAGSLPFSIRAPQEPGRYESVWQLMLHERPIGQPIKLAVLVKPKGGIGAWFEQLWNSIANAVQDLVERLQTGWDDFWRKVQQRAEEEAKRAEERAKEEARREAERQIRGLCGIAPATLVIACGGIVVRQRRRRRL